MHNSRASSVHSLENWLRLSNQQLTANQSSTFCLSLRVYPTARSTWIKIAVLLYLHTNSRRAPRVVPPIYHNFPLLRPRSFVSIDSRHFFSSGNSRAGSTLISSDGCFDLFSISARTQHSRSSKLLFEIRFLGFSSRIFIFSKLWPHILSKLVPCTKYPSFATIKTSNFPKFGPIFQ